MTGQRVGYVRVSTLDQNTVRQLAGVEVDRVFEDKASGKDQNRPELEEMIRFVRDDSVRPRWRHCSRPFHGPPGPQPG